MTYTDSQIERAKASYTNFLKLETLRDYDVATIGINEAQQRMAFHNTTVDAIKGGDKDLEAKWKNFFMSEVVISDRKAAESKAKLEANKSASADILAPIKAAKKIGEFGKWLNNSKNAFRKEHFTKKYTQASVDAFLAI